MEEPDFTFHFMFKKILFGGAGDGIQDLELAKAHVIPLGYT
jgi:hypothetical protein